MLSALTGWEWSLAIVAILAVYGAHPIKRWKYRRIPGPPPTWLIGNLASIIRMGFPEAMQRWAAEYGPVFKVWQGGNVIIVVEDPAAARLVNMHNHARPLKMLSNTSGKQRDFDKSGILLAEGYTDLMNASAERLVDVLATKSKSGQPVEIWRLFGCLTMEVVGSTAFGIELRALEGESKAIGTDPTTMQLDNADDDATQLQKCAAVVFGFSGARASPYVALNMLFPEAAPLFRRLSARYPDPALRKVLQARRKNQAVCYRLIREARQRMRSEAADGAATAADVPATTNGETKAAPGGDELPLRRPGSALPPGGFISHLLSAENKLIGRKFTDMEIAAQANTFLLAGYETTAAALAFTVYHIAQHPDKEAKLLAEIDAFGRDAVPSFEDLRQFPYLGAAFSEALRLLPPAGLGTIREAREDFQVCGYTIRKGWWMNTAQFSFQNNSKYWPDADKFVPERFLMEQGTAINPAWAPFGDGGRSCVGALFAKAEAKIALIRLYQSFTLRLVDGQVPLKTKTTITMAPANGVNMLVHPRP